MTKTVFIDGGAGTTGLEIADRLSGRGDLSIVTRPATPPYSSMTMAM